MSMLYPVSRNEGDGRILRSGLIGERLTEPSPINILFQHVISGITQTLMAVVASALIVVPPAPAEPAPIPLHLLSATPIIEAVEPPPSALIRVPFASPTEDQKLLFQRPLAGVVQDDIIVRLPALLPNPFPSPTDEQKLLLFSRPLTGVIQPEEAVLPSAVRTPEPITEKGLPYLLFQRPLSGLIQDVASYFNSWIIKPLEVPPPPPVNVLFQRPLLGIEQVLEVVSAPKILAPPFPPPAVPIDVLFQRPLAAEVMGIRREELVLELRSILIGERLPEPLPLPFILSQRPFAGIIHPILEVRSPQIIRVPVPDTLPPFPQELFLRPLKRGIVEDTSEYVSTLLYGIEPERDVLFLRPLAGKSQDGVDVATPAKVFGIVLPLPAPLDIVFTNPLAGKFQTLLEVGPSRIIKVTFPDVGPSPINVLFQRPLVGIVQDIEGIRAASFVPIPLPSPTDDQRLLFFGRPVAGVIQSELIILPSDFIRVRSADVPLPAIDILFQRILSGLLQEEIVVPRSSFIRVPTEEAVLRRLTALSLALDPTLSQTIMWTGNVLPISLVTAAPVDPPPSGKGVVFQVEGTIVRIYVWSGSAWQILQSAP